MITLASTAIPMVRMMPAIPGKVSVALSAVSAAMMNSTFRLRAMLAMMPPPR